MSTTSIFADAHAAAASGAASASPGLMKRLGDAFVAMQQARAERIVLPYLARSSEAELSGLGFDARQIAEIKRHRHDPVVRWV